MSSESALTLSRRAAVLFLDLLGRHDQLVLSRDLIRHRQLVADLLVCGMLVVETYASNIAVDVMDGQESVNVEADLNAGVARYTCPESGREMAIPLCEIQLYRVNLQRLCELMSEQLDIPSMYRDQLGKPLIPNHLWFLGKVNLDGANLPVFFARNLERHLVIILDKLNGRSETEGGVLLYSGSVPNASNRDTWSAFCGQTE